MYFAQNKNKIIFVLFKDVLKECLIDILKGECTDLSLSTTLKTNKGHNPHMIKTKSLSVVKNL